LDDRLRRREAFENVLLHRPVAHTVDEGLDDLEIDVRFKEREPNLAQSGLDVLRRKPPLASQRLEHILEAIAQGVEHAALNLSTVNHYRNGRVGFSQCDPAKSANTEGTGDETGTKRSYTATHRGKPCCSVRVPDLRVGAFRQRRACGPVFPSSSSNSGGSIPTRGFRAAAI